MTMRLMFLAAALVATTLACGVAHAGAITYLDTYEGGTAWKDGVAVPASQQDRIGGVDQFEIYSMTVDYDGTALDLTITSSYFDDVAEGKVVTTEMGDVWISGDGFSPNGTAANNYDIDTVSEDWEYVLVFDEHSGFDSGDVYLYAVYDDQGDLNGTIKKSWVDNTSYTYRDGQEVQFLPESGLNPLATGTWDITDVLNSNYDTMDISISWSGDLYSTGSNVLGFKWGMTCANDVIAIQTQPVPEPGTILLLGSGLVALGVSARRRKRAEAAKA